MLLIMHIPVLQKEVLEFLSPKADENFIDATIGGGGHAFEILKHTAPNGKLLGIDVNLAAIEDLKEKIKNEEIKNRLILICGNFSNLQNIVRDFNFNSVRGVLAIWDFHLERLKQAAEDSVFCGTSRLICDMVKMN
ncbi:MAG: 16S rRNA (cytosine(1402)-N(4))-methyltransferase [Candidatus Portnoybacteria bacterium CG_4_10_14_0_8_um_filter_40_50]|uniref:16S rRNA (Cytosine(1402)-N(4))-methyltransferase n=1 Tax=Candidatus Portnoybacteria bacterium CG_4_10_14_0_8_um_filter_40_50 TaxID=1974800 RepID=A0A2M7QR46_9BACT|nr:MAG: 16S rRNA (cytosine(1402)-N(4))-methyltransferase [Candidatus Portnoybacteria bacterium CG_4_10_14_0_8_um_filter_40_50]